MDYEVMTQDEQSIYIEQEKKRISTEIIDSLYALRKQKGLTQQAVSDATGIRRPNIARIEGKKFTPTIDVLVRYADSLGMKVEIKLVEK